MTSPTGDGDPAITVFSDPDEEHKPVHPKGERRPEREIDFMVLGTIPRRLSCVPLC